MKTSKRTSRTVERQAKDSKKTKIIESVKKV